MGLSSFMAMFTMSALGLRNGDTFLTIGGVIMMLLLVLLGWPNRYGIDQKRLTWHHGIAVNKSLKLADIDRVIAEEGKNGLMLKDVPGHRIFVGAKSFFVAAEDHKVFIEKLIDHCPHLRAYGFEYRRELVA